MTGLGPGGNKLNIDHLSENECERILGVLQRDFHLRSRERTRLRELAKDIWEEEHRRYALTSLSLTAKLTQTHCVSCLTKFGCFFDKPIKCSLCKHKTCKTCCLVKRGEEPRCWFCLKQAPEESLPSVTSKPPRHPRSLYSSQPLNQQSYNFPNRHSNEQYSLKQSLNQYTGEATTDRDSLNNARTSDRDSLYNGRYGSEQSLNYLGRQSPEPHNNHNYFQRRSLYGGRTESHNGKYGSHQDLDLSNGGYNRERRYSSSSSLSGAVTQFCSQCGDALSPNIKRKAQCVICTQWICKLCATWEPKHGGYVCEAHEDEEGYEQYNKESKDWVYDSENRRFVRTHSAEIAATIAQRLTEGGDYQSLPILEEIPSLSVADFEQSMGTTLSKIPENNHTSDGNHTFDDNLVDQSIEDERSNGTSFNQSPEEINHHKPSRNLLNADDFFKARAPQPENHTNNTAASLTDKLGELDKALSDNSYSEEDDVFATTKGEVSFESLKEEETKKFLVDVDISVQKIRDCLSNNDSEAQTEEMLTFHRSAISAMIANLEQALHLAVDNQTATATTLVKHTAVAAHVCDIIEEFTGDSLPSSVMETEGTLSYGEAADAILVKVLDEEESSRDNDEDDNSELSPTDYSKTESSDTASYSDYGSYKLPSFDGKFSSEVDPDLLSLGVGQQGYNTSYIEEEEEEEEDYFSEDGSPWDTESIVSATSNNWLFKGKIQALDSLSGKSSIFNTNSGSEESLNIMAVPRSKHGRDDGNDSDTGSDSTLTSLSGDSILPDDLDNLTPRGDTAGAFPGDAEEDDDMIRTELRRTNAQSIGAKADYVSVSRKTSVSTTPSCDKSSEYSESGEESRQLKFSSKPKSQNIRTGEVAKFSCTVHGASPIDVYWFKEGVEDTDAIESDDKYEVTSQDDRHTLEIFFASAEDSGQYLCLAKNDVTSSHWLFGLAVEDSSDLQEEKAPLFIKELYDMEAQEGETIKFRCKVRAYPPPRVSWYKDGKRITNTAEYKLEKFGNRDYILTISGVTLDHDAEFTCLAKNNAGEAKSSAQLVIDSGEVDDHRLPAASNRKDNSSKVNVSDKMTRRQRNYAQCYGSDKVPSTHSRNGTAESTKSPTTSVSSIINSNMALTVADDDIITPVIFEPILRSLSSSETPAADMPTPTPDSNLPNRKTDSQVPSVDQPIIGSASQNGDDNHAVINNTTDTPVREERTTPGSDYKTPRKSLRAAMRPNCERYSAVEENSAARITPSRVESASAKHAGEKDTQQKIPVKEQRQLSVVELGQVTPLKSESVPAESQPPNSKNSITQNKLSTDKNSAPFIKLKPVPSTPSPIEDKSPSAIEVPKLKSINQNHSENSEPLQTKKSRVDIQPGHVREKQFQELNDQVIPASTPKHNKASENTHQLINPTANSSVSERSLRSGAASSDVTKSPSITSTPTASSLSDKSSTAPSNTQTASPASKLSHKNRSQGAAPQPAVTVPETIELKGTANQDDLPSSRGEWSEAFPSIKQRRASFGSSDQPPLLAGRPRQDEKECNNNSTQIDTAAKPKSPKKLLAPVPPAVVPATTQTKTNGAGPIQPAGKEPSKKKSIKKVVKRTVSVKRSSVPAASFGDGPPDDGSDYIKICGKWVKMKAKSAQANKARADNSVQSGQASGVVLPQQSKSRGSSLSSHTEEDSIPASRSEWGDSVNIVEAINRFKQAQEATGSIITGRSLGPITKV